MARRRRPRGLRSGRTSSRGRWLAPILLGAVLTLASSMVDQRTVARYADVDACINGCTVAAAGWPLPYIVDYPGVSPANAASLSGAVLGVDRLRAEGLAIDFVGWTLLSWILIALLRRIRR